MTRWAILFVLVAAIVGIVKSGALGAGGLPATDVLFWVIVAAAAIIFLYNLLGFDQRLTE